MSGRIDEIASIAREAAADAVWGQWAVLGAPVAGASSAPRSVIDPEALLLLSAFLRPAERRLDDVLAWWAASGSTLLSVQRTTTLLRQYPPATQQGVAAFAAEAVKGGDGRWASLAKSSTEESTLAARGKRGGEPRLTSYPALMLRLRAAFGVGVKADLLSMLLAAANGQAATIRTLSQASGYTPAAVRRAAQEMEAAGVVHPVQGRPIAYYTAPERWAALLGTSPGEGSAWRWFAQVFSFLAWTSEWGDEHSESSSYVASTTARDLLEEHRSAFEQNRIPFPWLLEYFGESYVDPLDESVRMVTDWLRINL
jgi:hypothetical protein